MDNVLKMRMAEGAAGFGVYVMILESLRSSADYRVKYDPSVIAWSLHEPDQDLVNRVCVQYDLFQVSPDGYLSSPWLSAAMAQHEEKRAKLSAAGKKSAAARAASSNQVETTLQPHSNKVETSFKQNKTKENKENKENTTPSTIGDGGGVDIFDEGFISRIGKEDGELFDPDKHAQGVASDKEHNYNVMIAAAVTYRLTVNQFTVLMMAADGCTIGAPRFMAFIAALRHCKDTNFKPSFPFEYFMSQLKRVAA